MVPPSHPAVVRIALTQTVNAFADMPARQQDLPQLTDRLASIREANLDHHAELIATAARRGAKMIGMGELFAGPYFALGQLELWRGLAEDPHAGPTATRMRQLAQQHGVLLVAPIYERAADGRRFNSALVIDQSGELLGCYRKNHIPEGTNDVARFSERYYYERGDGGGYVADAAANTSSNHFPVFDTRFGRIGVAICYDRHFDGVMRSLAQAGAALIFCPAVTFGSKSQRMWRQEASVDACRHRVFIAMSNRCGSEPPWNIEYFGDSHVVGPNGVLENVSDDPQLVIADVPLAELAAADPAGWTLIDDRRDDIYGGG